MTSLRDLLGIEVRNTVGRYVDYRIGNQQIGSYNPYGVSYCFEFESEGIFEHRSDFERWFVDILTQQYAGVLPVILTAGKSRPYVRKVYLPFYMHYTPPEGAEPDCE